MNRKIVASLAITASLLLASCASDSSVPESPEVSKISKNQEVSSMSENPEFFGDLTDLPVELEEGSVIKIEGNEMNSDFTVESYEVLKAWIDERANEGWTVEEFEPTVENDVIIHAGFYLTNAETAANINFINLGNTNNVSINYTNFSPDYIEANLN